MGKQYLSIEKADYLCGYRVSCLFSDGHVAVTDLRKFLFGERQNPMVTKYRNKEKFRKFQVDLGNKITWGRNYEMVFGFDTFYEGGEVQPMTDAERRKIEDCLVRSRKRK